LGESETFISEYIAKMEAAVNGLVTLITNSYITTYGERVLALTPDFAKLSISPESSDGFASVGTILPKEEAALLPGGLFAFPEGGCARSSGIVSPKSGGFHEKKECH
jgi:hypothetical protein